MDGLVLINKNRGLTSHEIVKRVKNILELKKAGHFGTLDPMAEGLLLVGMGNATKLFDFFIKRKKVYSGIMRFGYSTTTYDSEGDMVGEEKDVDLYKSDLETIIQGFIGKIDQIPPKYSAKKFKGKPLYKYARNDIDVKIESRKVEIFSLKYKIIDKKNLWFKAVTSSGTYIRSLAFDIGERVGSGAFLKELQREKIGEFDVDNAVTLDELEIVKREKNPTKSIIPIESLLPEFPRITVGLNGKTRVINGAPISSDDILEVSSGSSSENYRIFDDDGNFLAIAKKDGILMEFKPFLVFNKRS